MQVYIVYVGPDIKMALNLANVKFIRIGLLGDSSVLSNRQGYFVWWVTYKWMDDAPLDDS